jgi:hypothetical protein
VKKSRTAKPPESPAISQMMRETVSGTTDPHYMIGNLTSYLAKNIPTPRRFPPPWSFEELDDRKAVSTSAIRRASSRCALGRSRNRNTMASSSPTFTSRAAVAAIGG